VLGEIQQVEGDVLAYDRIVAEERPQRARYDGERRR